MSRKHRGRGGSREKLRGRKKPAQEYVGKAIMSREGSVFVKVDGQEEDIYVKASKTRGALHGDTVKVVEIGRAHV